MSRPIILISSTYFDLISERAVLNAYLTDLGYDVKLHEKGNITYGKSRPLDSYIYEDINSIDFLVGIIGRRLGCKSSDDNCSVTQAEIKHAIDNNKKVFIFIHNDVYNEYSTYSANKTRKRIKYTSVDSVEIFRFIDYLKELDNNNYMASYNSVEDIKTILSTQLSGIYKKLLTEDEGLSTLYKGARFSVFRSRDKMIDYFDKIIDKAKKGDILWAQGVGHTAYPRLFPIRLTKLLKKGVEVQFIVNRKSPQYDDFTEILREIPGLEFYPSYNNKVRLFGLSNHCVIVALPHPEKYEAILINDEYITSILFEWFKRKFNLLREGVRDLDETLDF